MRNCLVRMLSALVPLAIAGGCGALCPATALAGPEPVPELVATVESVNPYGLQAGLCSQGKEEPLTPCGVDPFTHSGTAFDRLSGFNTYRITVANNSSQAKPVTVVDELPKGMVLAANEQVVASGKGWQCNVVPATDPLAVARAASCYALEPLAAGATSAPIVLHVYVGEAAEDSSRNVVRVSGGGASAETEKVTEKVTTVESVPFGIESFNANVEAEHIEAEHEASEKREPFNKAGGHPFSVTTNFVLNFVPNPTGTGLEGARSGIKEAQVELPPGLIGNPRNAGECPIQEFRPERFNPVDPCPTAAERNGPASQPGQQSQAVGYVEVFENGQIAGGKANPFGPEAAGNASNARLIAEKKHSGFIYNLTPTPGHPAEFGFVYLEQPFVLKAKLRSDGDYGVTVGDEAAGPSVLAVRATFCGYGVTKRKTGEINEYECEPPNGGRPFLTNPTQCSQAPLWSLRTDSWAEANEAASRGETPAYALTETYANEGEKPSEKAPPSFAGREPARPAQQGPKLEGCNELSFNPLVEAIPESAPPAPEAATADSPTGLTVNLRIPQTNSSKTRATPHLRNAVITLPEGLTISPAGADGLEACTNEQFGLGTEFAAAGVGLPPGVKPIEPANEAECPPASQIGSVKVTTPLLAEPLEGQVFVGQPECAPCEEGPEGTGDAQKGRIFRLFIQVRDPKAGVIVKLVGRTKANEQTGRLESVFENQPQTPFELLELKLKGGPRASLESPQSCGRTSLVSSLTPWSDPEGSSAPAFEEPSFNVTGCEPGRFAEASDPPFEAGTSNPAAASYSPFGVTLARDDREENLAGVQVTMPPGLTAKIAGVPECSEEQANAHNCPPETQIGTATAGAGPGEHPFFEHGQVYFTGPYKGAPFGLEIVIPAVAGPFNLGNIVVRQAISVDSKTTAVTVTSDPFPQIHDGVPLRLRKVNVSLNPGFILNPTNCAEQPIAATLTAASGQSRPLSYPYAASGCRNLSFKPSLSASTEAKTSKALGASFKVKVTAKPGEANIRKTELQIPSILPSRLTTLQKACTQAVFEADPATCPEGSVIGQATVHTPLLSGPLRGPAILVSHGGAAFPDVIFVLQGQGIRLDLDGATDIKRQITYSKFETVPDQPVESFETVLPRGPHSVLTANGNLCKAHLVMPTLITAQNGAVIKQNTKITVSGCPKDLTRAQRLAAALKACKKKPRRQQAACRRRAYHLYGPAKTAKKAKKAKKASLARPASAQGSPAGQGSAAPQGASPALATGGAPLKAALAPTPVDPPANQGCPNEQRRDESRPNPEAQGAPYSTLLPECRAYEMVSPLEKQGHGAGTFEEGLPVAPAGDRVGFASEGDFAEPANFAVKLVPFNAFISERIGANAEGAAALCSPEPAPCWTTRSALAPADPIAAPSLEGLLGDFTADMGAQVSCGLNRSQLDFACALHESLAAASWVSSPLYATINGTGVSGTQDYRGASSDLSRIFIQPGSDLLPEDVVKGGEGAAGIYEITAIGTPSPGLRLVNVGNEHGSEKEGELNMKTHGPLLGDSSPAVLGTAYHAISEDGRTVFFSAIPTAAQQGDLGVKSEQQGVQTVYARVRHSETEAETVAVSNPTKEECGACSTEKPEPQAATYQGASANGKKVFFTTTQKLLNKDPTTNLYEYDFENAIRKKLVLLSGDSEPAGARVEGVVRSSSNGARVYFVAQGVLGVGPAHERLLAEGAKAGADNLYGVSTEIREGTEPEVKFVGELSEQDFPLWGEGAGLLGEVCGPRTVQLACDRLSREAQTTPDGRYLVFSTYAHLSEAEPGGPHPAQAVYRYDFATGRLTWVSHAAHGFETGLHCTKADECQNAIITPLNGQELGATAGIDDWGRAVSGCPGKVSESERGGGCQELGEHDGEDVIFTTREKLQTQAINEQVNVYLWHCSSPCEHPATEGNVSLISDGQDPEGADVSPNGVGFPGMSASGSDIFFATKTALVGQDRDELADVYDARINGGAPAPHAALSCFAFAPIGPQEECQLGPSPAPLLGSPASQLFTGPSTAPAAPATTASVRVTSAKLKGNRLVVTVENSLGGTVTMSGRGLRSVRETLPAGTHQLQIPLTNTGQRMKRQRRETKLDATLKATERTASAALAVRL